jgi:hypothetical protein
MASYLSLGFKVYSSHQLQNIDDAPYAGLLFARAYAVTDRRRLVLAVLGLLGCSAIISALVSFHVFCDHALQTSLLQLLATLDGCDITSAVRHKALM